MCSHPQLEGETASSGTFVPIAPEQRPQVSREVRLLEGARGPDICGAHQDIFPNLTHQGLLYYTLRVC